MPNTTASTLITRALDNINRASNGTTRSGSTMSTLMIDYLNRAMNRMSRKHDFREMHKTYSASTVASQKSYSFPDNYKVIKDLRVIDWLSSRRLHMMHQRTFDEYHPYPEINTTNRPEVYTPFGNAFDLYPIPNAVYTMYIRTIQWPTVISSTSSAIDYFPDKDDIIVSCMTSDGFKHLQMFEDGVLW